MTSLHASSCLLLLSLIGACANDCPEGQVLAGDRQGTRRSCIAAASTSEETSTTDDPSSSGMTTASPPCDDDPACGPDEDVSTCPSQCSLCGDSILSGDEACDRGPDNQTYWPSTPPPDTCSDTCNTLLEWCGDAIQNASEPCDNGNNADPIYSAMQLPPGACAPACTLPGHCGDANINASETCDNGNNTDPDYTFNPPPADACTPTCTLPGHCGDAIINGNEPCDDAAQTNTCELSCLTPACGDGTLNPLAGEVCDDTNNNDGDGCSADCNSIERLVFVSSLQYEGDFIPMTNNPDALSGLALADLRCKQLATAATLPGTYKAWLSTTTDSPSTRFDTRFTGLYRLTSPGAPIIAIGWQGLSSSTLLHPIDADESGTSAQKNVWTNTLPDGTTASDLDCAAWTMLKNAMNMPLTTTIGTSTAIDATWTNLADGQLCSDARRLYCFQDV